MSDMKVQCSRTQMMALSNIKPHPRNPNKHTEQQIKLLAKIMKHQGWRNPITISNQSGYIVTGHGRLEAAKLNGWTSAPVDLQDFRDEADEYAHRVADNKIAELAETDLSMVNEDFLEFGPDFDVDLLGIPDFEIEPAEKYAMKEEVEDDVPTNVDTRCKPGDLWILGEHRLLCGDATNVQHVDKLMGGENPELIFTDPPYGIDYQDIKKNHDKIANDSHISGLEDLMSLTLSIECPKFICCNWKCYPEFYRLMTAIGSNPKSCIVWDKNHRIQNLDKFGKQHEFILYSGPFGGEKTVDVDVWQCKRETRKDHPTSKPVELIERALGHFKAKTVLDTFGGSGSTLIACEKLRKRCFIMELSPQYASVIISRWEKYSEQEAKLHD